VAGTPKIARQPYRFAKVIFTNSDISIVVENLHEICARRASAAQTAPGGEGDDANGLTLPACLL
jgi:hypothetical protein